MATTITVDLWRTETTERADRRMAVETLSDVLAPQVAPDVGVRDRGTLAIDDRGFDSYDEYLRAFTEAVDPDPGTIAVCLYDYFTRGFDELGEFLLESVDDLVGDRFPDDVYYACGMEPGDDDSGRQAPPWVGYADSGLRADRPTHVVVNAVWRELPFVDDVLFRNALLHEVLHPLVDHRRAPVPGDDHSYGTNADGANSPLLTTYAEWYSNNDPPAAGCDQPDGVRSTTAHTTELSRCTRAEVERYVAEHLDE